MILRGSVFSHILEMETGLTVVTPNDLRTGHPYKVVYLLHGLCGRSGDWADYTMLPVYAQGYPVVFVLPEAARSFYTDMKYGSKYFSYVRDELPSLCKSIFNISSQREDTAIFGNSMGGYGALKCALSKPEQYGYCAAFASACLFLHELLDTQRNTETAEIKARYGEQLPNDFEAAFGKDLTWNPQDDIQELAKSAIEKKNKPKLYCTCGTEDPFRPDHLRFRDEMKKLDLDFTYEEWPAGHNWYFFNESLRKALGFYFQKL